ncbi:hypothetical protein, partial [Arcicella aurantiaca]|uniref:hypothetical protein n=1 Tax=Arcicella aurantiaca TaxID=591202 RepID=UPI001B86B6A5
TRCIGVNNRKTDGFGFLLFGFLLHLLVVFDEKNTKKMYIKVYQYSERGQINATNDCNTSSIKRL